MKANSIVDFDKENRILIFDSTCEYLFYHAFSNYFDSSITIPHPRRFDGERFMPDISSVININKDHHEMIIEYKYSEPSDREKNELIEKYEIARSNRLLHPNSSYWIFFIDPYINRRNGLFIYNPETGMSGQLYDDELTDELLRRMLIFKEVTDEFDLSLKAFTDGNYGRRKINPQLRLVE